MIQVKNHSAHSFISNRVLRQEHHLLLEKLSALEKKVIVGGVDLLAKAEEQEKLLQESNNELEERRRRAEQLRKELEEKEVRVTKSHCSGGKNSITAYVSCKTTALVNFEHQKVVSHGMNLFVLQTEVNCCSAESKLSPFYVL